jgi:acyl-CoA hydrolase
MHDTMPKLIHAADVPPLLRPGCKVFVQGGSGEPSAVLAALRQTGPSCGGVNYFGILPTNINRWDPASFAPDATMTAFFATPEMAESLKRGATSVWPLRYSAIDRYLTQAASFDAALIQVAPPDSSGMCSLGVSVDFVPAMFARASMVIAEINPSMPAPPGSISIPFDKLAYAVETDHPLIEPAPDDTDEASRRIGETVATLIPDGSTIQMGTGRIPTAVLAAMKNKNDLGFHSGLMTEPVLDLIEAGNINGRRKVIDAGKAVTGITYGRQSFYQRLRTNPDILYRPVSYTHDADVIRRQDQLIAINSALEVDLAGQVNAEFVNGRQISGIGGLGDFVYGASLARNGRSIIALPSRGGRGKSRIVLRLDHVTLARSDADLVVTEFGVADLRHKASAERAAALTEIAAPEFRDELRAAYAGAVMR